MYLVTGVHIRERRGGFETLRVTIERSCDKSHNDGGRDWCPAAPSKGMPLASKKLEETRKKLP